MDDILTATAVEYHEQYAPAIERVWQDEVELLRADVRGWLTQMSERSNGYLCTPHCMVRFSPSAMPICWHTAVNSAIGTHSEFPRRSRTSCSM